MVSSRLIGALFLAGFLCYGIGFSLVTSVVGKSDFMESLTAHRIPLVVGALLMLLNMPVDIAKGVLFFPILDRYGRRTALTYLVMISAEAVMAVMPGWFSHVPSGFICARTYAAPRLRLSVNF